MGYGHSDRLHLGAFGIFMNSTVGGKKIFSCPYQPFVRSRYAAYVPIEELGLQHSRAEVQFREEGNGKLQFFFIFYL